MLVMSPSQPAVSISLEGPLNFVVEDLGGLHQASTEIHACIHANDSFEPGTAPLRFASSALEPGGRAGTSVCVCERALQAEGVQDRAAEVLQELLLSSR
jgi:hypothetical protein